MTDKKFTAVWDVVKGFNPMDLLSNNQLSESVEKNIDIEPYFLFFENDEYKIYIFKMNPYEVTIKVQQYFSKI